MINYKKTSLTVVGTALLITGLLKAAVTTVPDSSLTPSTGYYTDTIGGGIGNIVVMTGGGANAGIGDPSGRNDDGFSGPINLGFTVNFFGTNYTQFWINNNGNISFGAGVAAFVPMGPIGASQPVISPFFTDVDTRPAESGVVHLRTDIPNEIIVTWDQVAYFSAPATKFDSFQLVLRGPGFSIPAGEGQVGFFYKTMQWETGNAGGGVGGFCSILPIPCFPAAVGLGDGQSNGFVLQGSGASGIGAIVANHHIWFALSNLGMPTAVSPASGIAPTPAPDTLGLLAFGLTGLGLWRWWARRRRSEP